MRISSRELMLGLMTLTIALFGGTFLLARPRLNEWQQLQKRQERLGREMEIDRNLLAKRDYWEARLAELSAAMPQYRANQKTDVLWLSTITSVAQKHGLEIRSSTALPEKELQQGDVYELRIECPEWEGSLDALIHFLFDLQSRGAMLDMRFLLIKPKAAKVLRGRFSLDCAYTRGEPVTQSPVSPELP